METVSNSDLICTATAVETIIQNIKKKRKHKDSIDNREEFPLKLFRMLNEETQEDIVKWMGNGEYFKVYDKKRFLTDVAPKYFRRNDLVITKKLFALTFLSFKL